HAMGELEYYVISPATDSFPAVDQRGYHESEPFAKHNGFRARCMATIASIGGAIKYGHSEVGNFTLDGMIYEQNEIEFLPVDARNAADQLLLAKWVIRSLAHREGLNVTFAPKITAGKAGSGLHFHTRLMRDGRNVMIEVDDEGNNVLSNDARRLIAGMMVTARSLTAFGNMIPTSYFRLVPHQEAPTSVCWGDRNRSVLVRVPLGWTAGSDMCELANPGRSGQQRQYTSRQTVEIRSADASADIYLFLAGLAVAATLGFTMGDEALEIARRTYVDINIHAKGADERRMALESLPASCTESADVLEKDRAIYEANGIFNPAVIDAVIARLRAIGDVPSADQISPDRMMEFVKKYFYCG
ncbi:MAG: glutamine synthetase, partial [Muribaculaceae bacterium]|nr:glutamine synthetase [Muribaculaceae bacterium]